MQRVGPLVSVVVPVYDEMTTIQETLRTVVAQEYDPFEVIVVDDGSTDASAAVARAFADGYERIRVVENRTNMGLAFTRTRGAMLAEGDYLVFHDADDLSTPDRFARQVRFLEDNPDVAVVGSAYYYLNPVRDERVVRVRPTDDRTLRHNLARESMVNVGTAMYRWSALAETDLFRTEHADAYDLLIRLAEDHDIANLRTPLYVYRIGEDSMSRSNQLEQKLTLVRRGVQAARRLGVGYRHLLLTPGWLAYIYLPDRLKAVVRRLFSPTDNRTFSAEDERRLERTLAIAEGADPVDAGPASENRDDPGADAGTDDSQTARQD